MRIREGEVDLGLAAGGHAHALHLLQDAGGAAVDVEGDVAQAQHVHKAVGVIDIRLDAVRHQHAQDVLPAIGPDAEGGGDAGVLAAGDADDSRLAAAGGHLGAHPVNEAGQLLFGVEFHGSTLLFLGPPLSRRFLMGIF